MSRRFNRTSQGEQKRWMDWMARVAKGWVKAIKINRYASGVNKEQECARRRRQIERGIIPRDQIWEGAP